MHTNLEHQIYKHEKYGYCCVDVERSKLVGNGFAIMATTNDKNYYWLSADGKTGSTYYDPDMAIDECIQINGSGDGKS